MGSDVLHLVVIPDVAISIHAPRVGSDGQRQDHHALRHISIHAPRVGSDRTYGVAKFVREDDFNPRSPRGERRVAQYGYHENSLFQSTLPAWGATLLPLFLRLRASDFNPRSPRGERL